MMVEMQNGKGAPTPEPENSDWQDYIAPVVAMALTLFFLVASYRLSEKARMVPLLALYANLVFVSLELLARIPTNLGRSLRRVLLGNAPPIKILGGYHGKPLSREIAAIVLIVSFCAAVQVVGILPMVPIFVVFYMLAWAKKSLRSALLAAIVISVFVMLLFEVVLGVRLYPGLLLNNLFG